MPHTLPPIKSQAEKIADSLHDARRFDELPIEIREQRVNNMPVGNDEEIRRKVIAKMKLCGLTIIEEDIWKRVRDEKCIQDKARGKVGNIF